MRNWLGGFGKKNAEKVKQMDHEFLEVVQGLRELGKKHCPQSFEELPILKALKNGPQFTRLGNLLYENAEEDPNEVKKALSVWKRGMETGHNPAKFSYAMCLKKGIGFDKPNVSQAVKYFKELTEAGHAWGAFAYADALRNGEGIKKNEKKAFHLLQKCAASGIPPAFYNIGNMYSSGSGVAQNDREAIKWYEKAATVGDPQAKARLAEIYSHGKGVPKDISKALQFYKEAASAGIPIAQYNLGYMYLMGENLPQDFLRAEYLFRRAGEQGFLLAMVNLAQMYTMGLGTVPKDLALARKWLELAAPYDTNAKKLLCSLNEVEQVERIHVGKDNRNREEILNS